jgi:hypothetical protein
MDTSGAVIIDKTINETIALLSKAGGVNFNISVDGAANVQTYIRYSPKNLASLDNILKFISIFKKNNISFVLSPTIMVYNIFSIDKLLNWWLHNMTPAFEELSTYTDIFSNILLGPDYLSLRALQPATIGKLIDYYSNIPEIKEYNHQTGAFVNLFPRLVHILDNTEYGGPELHNQMVKYTLDMDKIKGQNVLDAVPELTDEMVLI